MSMTSLERCVAAIQFKEADRVPCVPIICGAARRVYGISYKEWCQDEELCAKAWLQSQELFGYDAFVTLVDLSLECSDFGQEVLYPEDDTPHPNYDNPIITCPDDFVTKVKPIDFSKAPRMQKSVKMHDILMNEAGSKVAVVGFVFGPLGILSMMRGAEKLFVDCVKHKKEVLAAERVITDVLKEYIRALCKVGCHSIMLDTLFASGCIMSKKLWKDIEAPFAKELADTIRECGALVSWHNCGGGVYIRRPERSDGAVLRILMPACPTTARLAGGEREVCHRALGSRQEHLLGWPRNSSHSSVPGHPG